MIEHLAEIRDVYDLTFEEHWAGVDPLSKVPPEFHDSVEFKVFQNTRLMELQAASLPRKGVSFVPNLDHPHVHTMFKQEFQR